MNLKLILLFLFLFSSLSKAQKGNPSGNIGGMPAYHIDDLWRWSLGLSYTLQNQQNYNNSSIPSVSTNAKSQLNLESGLALELDARWLAQKSWGLIAGLNVDFGRAVTSGTLTSSSGVSFSYITTDSPKLQTAVLFVEAAYRWKQLYIPFGLNYGAFIYTPRSSFSGSTSTQGGLGAQVGIGTYMRPRFPVEAYYRMIPIRQSLNYSGGAIEDYGSGLMTSFIFTMKFDF